MTNRSFTRRALIGSCVALFLAMSTTRTAQPKSAPATTQAAWTPKRILFVGNSYTFHNGGQHVLLRQLAKSSGIDVYTEASVSGGKTLEWHWNEGKAREAITKGRWDVVVLQDYSTRPLTAPEKLFEYARKFDEEIKKVGARTAFFLTWARQHQPENQQKIADVYTKIAQELDAYIAPVGVAWQQSLKERPDLLMHMPDMSHPTQAGSYLAACVFYATMFGQSPVGLPAKIVGDDGKVLTELLKDDAKFLQMVAWKTASKPQPAATPATTTLTRRKVIYVCDATGTMLGLKFRLLQKELFKAIDALEPEDQYNIIFFAGGDSDDDWAKPLAPKLIPASSDGREKGKTFVGKFKVVGAGTNPLPALRRAISQRPTVIYFLTDGQFDNVVSYDQILAELDKLNRAKTVKINTICFMSEDAEAEKTLVEIAQRHGGRFVKVTERELVDEPSPSTAPTAPR